MPRRRVLVVSNDHVGSRMAGPGIRSYRFAEELAKRHDVALVVPYPSDLSPETFALVHDDPWSAPRMTARAREFDAVVAQRLPVETMRALAGSPTLAVYDLYAPVTIENLALDAREAPAPGRDVTFRLNRLSESVTLRYGDAFVCASERQRDLWLGALLAAGRVDHRSWARDPALRSLVEVVPFGIEPQPAHGDDEPAIKGVVEGIAANDSVLLWPGGIWNWFDPLTVIRAVERLAADRPEIRLVFLGMRHPNPGVPAMRMAADAVRLAEERGLRDRIVFFLEGWVPYDRRWNYLRDADAGVSAHFDDLESRFAFRTRLLDCFWAGLPVVTTRGDSLGDLVEARGLGRTVPPGDVDGWVEALAATLDGHDRPALDASLARVREELAWERVVEPLERLLALAKQAEPPRRLLRDDGTGYVRMRIQHAVLTHGARGAAARAARRLAERVTFRSGHGQ